MNDDDIWRDAHDDPTAAGAVDLIDTPAVTAFLAGAELPDLQVRVALAQPEQVVLRDGLLAEAQTI
jgi:hypothetical protein